jgi:hypothetical protein
MTVPALESVEWSTVFAAVTTSGKCFLTNSHRSASDIPDASSKPRNAPIASWEMQMARIFPSIQISMSVLVPLDRIESVSIASLPRAQAISRGC